MPMTARNNKRSFAINSLLQSPEGLLDRFAFLYFDFGQNTFTSSPRTAANGGHRKRLSGQNEHSIFLPVKVNVEMVSQLTTCYYIGTCQTTA